MKLFITRVEFLTYPFYIISALSYKQMFTTYYQTDKPISEYILRITTP